MSKSRRSVLSRQRPKRKGKAKRGPWVFRGLIFCGSLAIIGGIGYGVWQTKKTPTKVSGDRKINLDWQITVNLPDNQSLPESKLNEVIASAAKHLGDGSHEQLKQVARAIQRLEAFSRVHVVRLAEHRIALDLRLRLPLLCIEADRLRFVSEDGEVFGQADTPGQACSGPRLSGVLSSQGKLTLERDFTLSLKDDEKALIKEAIELMSSGRDQRFAFSTITYKRYRGFFATLSGSEAEIALGRAPFADKLSRLSGILTKLAEKGEQAARIELDYQGKAFVKLKKL